MWINNITHNGQLIKSNHRPGPLPFSPSWWTVSLISRGAPPGSKGIRRIKRREGNRRCHNHDGQHRPGQENPSPVDVRPKGLFPQKGEPFPERKTERRALLRRNVISSDASNAAARGPQLARQDPPEVKPRKKTVSMNHLCFPLKIYFSLSATPKPKRDDPIS